MSNAGLMTKSGGAIPLRGVEVTGEVVGGWARVVVRQRYQNAEAKPVEAVYTFPLPADATLAGFAMSCNGRRIEGEVREREEAFRAYDDAIVAGHGAALVEQERPNVFTASVGNLLPGEETLVELEYLQRVQADEGALRWMIPTLVAPRYIPGAPAGDRTGHGRADPTDRVPDADRITPPHARQVGYGLALDLTFDLGRDVVVESPSHAVKTEKGEGHRVRVTLAQREVALDRDVVLTARGANESQQLVTVAAHRQGDEDGFFALTVVPDLLPITRTPPRQDVVFVIDTSGSMVGASLPQAQAALRLCMRHLREGDRFNVIEFNSTHRAFAPEPVLFTQRTLEQADAWVAALYATGGTEILGPMVEAVRSAKDGVVVLLTDGQVGNEDEILREVMAARGRARVYSFGIGTNVSDALLRGLARQTGGAVEFIHPGERIDEKVVAQFARAVAARVTDVSVKFVGVEVGELAPGELRPRARGDPWQARRRDLRAGGALRTSFGLVAAGDSEAVGRGAHPRLRGDGPDRAARRCHEGPHREARGRVRGRVAVHVLRGGGEAHWRPPRLGAAGDAGGAGEPARGVGDVPAARGPDGGAGSAREDDDDVRRAPARHSDGAAATSDGRASTGARRGVLAAHRRTAADAAVRACPRALDARSRHGLLHRRGEEGRATARAFLPHAGTRDRGAGAVER
jgi:Ca-activated chloride channel family protein